MAKSKYPTRPVGGHMMSEAKYLTIACRVWYDLLFELSLCLHFHVEQSSRINVLRIPFAVFETFLEEVCTNSNNPVTGKGLTQSLNKVLELTFFLKIQFALKSLRFTSI